MTKPKYAFTHALDVDKLLELVESDRNIEKLLRLLVKESASETSFPRIIFGLRHHRIPRTDIYTWLLQLEALGYGWIVRDDGHRYVLWNSEARKSVRDALAVRDYLARRKNHGD